MGKQSKSAPRRAGKMVASVGSMTLACASAWGDQDDRLLKLAIADQATARNMNAFVGRMEEKYFGRIERMNGALALETLERQTDDTDYVVRVTRGPVVAKAGSMLAFGKKQQPGRPGGEILWSRFYSLDMHAATPLVGMLHATVVTQFYTSGQSFAGGWIGIMNGRRIPEDMTVLKAMVDAHFARYGRDPAIYRKLMMKGTDDVVAQFRRRPDEAGVSFYGPPVFPGDTAKSLQFVSELFDAFTGAYLDLVERRTIAPFTPADVAAKEAMEKRWLVDQLFSDPFSSKLVPFEVWSLANAPPVIKF